MNKPPTISYEEQFAIDSSIIPKTGAMTDQQIIETLAQREGWTKLRYSEANESWLGVPPNGRADLRLSREWKCPKYLSYLDSLQPILATLTEEEWLDLEFEVIQATKENGFTNFKRLALMKPSQLARCIGKVIAGEKGKE